MEEACIEETDAASLDAVTRLHVGRLVAVGGSPFKQKRIRPHLDVAELEWAERLDDVERGVDGRAACVEDRERRSLYKASDSHLKNIHDLVMSRTRPGGSKSAGVSKQLAGAFHGVVP